MVRDASRMNGWLSRQTSSSVPSMSGASAVIRRDDGRVHRRDLHGDVPRELAEVVRVRDEVGLAVEFDEDADAAAGVDVAFDDAVGGFAVRSAWRRRPCPFRGGSPSPSPCRRAASSSARLASMTPAPVSSRSSLIIAVVTATGSYWASLLLGVCGGWPQRPGAWREMTVTDVSSARLLPRLVRARRRTCPTPTPGFCRRRARSRRRATPGARAGFAALRGLRSPRRRPCPRMSLIARMASSLLGIG